jgi:hypothetical protein
MIHRTQPSTLRPEDEVIYTHVSSETFGIRGERFSSGRSGSPISDASMTRTLYSISLLWPLLLAVSGSLAMPTANSETNSSTSQEINQHGNEDDRSQAPLDWANIDYL